MAPVVEHRTPGTPWTAWRRPLYVAELAQLGHARQEGDSKWKISPEGYEMLRLAARGELPMSAWPTARPSS